MGDVPGLVRWSRLQSRADPRPVPRSPSHNHSGTWRSSARDAPGVARALSRLGKRIRALRLARKLTQERAAETAKLDEKHWQDIEGGRTNPTVATLVGIARALDVQLRGLFEQDDDEKRPPAAAPVAAATPSPPAPKSRPKAKPRSSRSRG